MANTRGAAVGEAPLRRRTLLYNHMPKTGGNFSRAALVAAVPKASLRYQTERQSVTEGDYAEHFVVGSFRHPCDYALSLWAYHCTGGAVDFTAEKRAQWERADILGRTPPFTGLEDVARFRRFIGTRYARGHTALSDRLLHSYGWQGHANFSRRAAHCWIGDDDRGMVGGLRDCLERFEAAGGEVRWNAFKRHVAEARPRNPSSHGPCAHYFDAPALAEVEHKAARVMRVMGFKTCCAADTASRSP